MEAVIFMGLQASGKSTFYHQNFSYTHMRINLDMLNRRSREDQFIKTCLQTQQKFVVDNTNLTKPSRFHYITDAMLNDFEVLGYYFRADVNRSLAWNSHRDGKARVPDVAILGSYKKLELPSYDEGFDKLFYVTIDDNQQFVIEDWQDEI
jgi:predicted kinase